MALLGIGVILIAWLIKGIPLWLSIILTIFGVIEIIYSLSGLRDR